MKLSVKFLLVSIVSITFNAHATNPTFNHEGIQKGAISESCYRDPCSVAKVMEFEILEKTPQATSIRLKIIGGSREWDAKKTLWDHDFHDVYVTCSIKEPTVKTGDQITIVPINPEGSMIGVLISDAELYLHTCHNYDGEISKAAKKYGYNITNDSTSENSTSNSSAYSTNSVGHVYSNDEISRAIDNLSAHTKQREFQLKRERAELAEYQQTLAKKSNVRIGMSTNQVLNESNWGYPDDINTNINTYGKFEQWVYGNGQYLYFTNGKLTSIQY